MYSLAQSWFNSRVTGTIAAAVLVGATMIPAAPASEDTPGDGGPWADYLRRYCVACHSSDDANASIDFAAALLRGLKDSTRESELALRQVKRRQMPPHAAARPDELETARFVEHSQAILDQLARSNPQPVPTASLRRLNRREYQNAVRDLLDLDIPAATWLPVDELIHSFDTAGTGPMTPTLLDRYLTAAQRIASLAVGSSTSLPAEETIRVPVEIARERLAPLQWEIASHIYQLKWMERF